MSNDLDFVIRRADVVTASDRFSCDIGIRAGRVAMLGHGLPRAPRELDATGMLVMPGGVDAHCHLDQPMPDGLRMADDFLSGTRSALCGGTTTVIPFAAQAKGQSLQAAVDDYHRRAQGRALIDYGFHLIVADPTPQVLAEELPRLIANGYTSFKVYMTYDDLKLNDRQMLDVLSVARAHGALVMVHAENSDCIGWLTERLLGDGHVAPHFHAHARPAVVEREATHRAIAFAELVDVPILIVHVSGAEAIEQIRWGQSRGLPILAETCPQYLYLTAADLGHPGDDGYEGAKCVCSPPPRDPANQQAVWKALQQGVFSVFSSDHAPFNYDDPCGKHPGGQRVSFDHIPNGIPGLETRLPLLFDGVRKGRLSLHQFVELTSLRPAKLYGLYPRKGTIAVGADADIVVWDPDRRVRIANASLHHAVDYTPYEGVDVTGWPRHCLSRGELLVEDGRLLAAEPGRGQFLPAGKPCLD
ncbi:dihydropyrimidinase [Burkholderia pseudomultivorans]|uniref:D-hydantoinase n=1 Tax=Burkholderia pseudomultivorans TaxID=1207504 RepID=A0A6P2IGJ4_9BURK|nr:dihydropyrimidinase [Burkholderia pseudomultivorans]MDR8727732.1 D-hydantoinase [Burkholderia pseudomultivorans]MDR8735696.1 D-hydantoinase [Burkholderia pseudomultivorans]MDR8742766.1 D-hydantoinase [Burkholderia pseudomultivorans]MDR8753809.1 D-hydantoinase [Burkholderia pseudomultivorans]MDR8779032.1 D-hydantoinase [Burkholderia pseudomultivorans]